VDDEKGIRWSVTADVNRAAGSWFSRTHGTFDIGVPLPMPHSSVWLRSAAGVALFGLVALAIAGTGLVGIVKHTVAHRSREMAVRLALGALPTALHRLVVRQAIMPVLAGLTIGVGVCWWGTRLLATQLYGVNPRDTLAFASAGAVLLAVALIAAWFPARQVTRIAPMETLRAD
jgi:ABC-type antimicrobial peptide transport system permease subunit